LAAISRWLRSVASTPPETSLKYSPSRRDGRTNEA
jgi:hypothetical protein